MEYLPQPYITILLFTAKEIKIFVPLFLVPRGVIIIRRVLKVSSDWFYIKRTCNAGSSL